MITDDVIITHFFGSSCSMELEHAIFLFVAAPIKHIVSLPVQIEKIAIQGKHLSLSLCLLDKTIWAICGFDMVREECKGIPPTLKK